LYVNCNSADTGFICNAVSIAFTSSRHVREASSSTLYRKPRAPGCDSGANDKVQSSKSWWRFQEQTC